MTIEEAINWYETKLAANEAIKLYGPQNDAVHLGLAALRAQQDQPKMAHGRWIKSGQSIHCSKCHRPPALQTKTKFRPPCGAKMDGALESPKNISAAGA